MFGWVASPTQQTEIPNDIDVNGDDGDDDDDDDDGRNDDKNKYLRKRWRRQ